MGDPRGLQGVLVLAALMLMCSAAAVGAAPAQSASMDGLNVEVEVVTEEVLLGEPVFIRIDLRNTAEVPLYLHEMKDLEKWYWQARIQGPDDYSLEIDIWREMQGGSDRWGLTEWQLGPGEARSTFYRLWFSAWIAPKERKVALPFPRKGKYTLTLWDSVSWGRETGQHTERRVEFSFTIRVRGPGKGFARLVEGVRQFGDDMRKLSKLVDDLESTPYADYVRWLWLREFLEQPPRPFSEKKQNVLNRWKLALRYADRILSNPRHRGTPVERSALTLKAYVHTAAAGTLMSYWEYRSGKGAANKALLGWLLSQIGAEADPDSISREQSVRIAKQQIAKKRSALRELQRRFPPTERMRRMQKCLKEPGVTMRRFLKSVPEN